MELGMDLGCYRRLMAIATLGIEAMGSSMERDMKYSLINRY